MKITVLALIIVIFVLIGGYNACNIMGADTRQQNANHLAQKWAERMFPDAKQPITVDCQSIDTDANGYLSCTLNINEKLTPIECYSYLWMDLGNTCRAGARMLIGQ